METSYQGFLNTGLPSLDALVHAGAVNGKANSMAAHAVTA